MVGWVPLAPREIYRPAYGASLGYVNRLNPGAPWRQAPPPGQGNRAVPGAVTLLPTPALRPHQPVAAAALGAGGLPSPLPAGRPEQFHHQAPAQPTWPARDSISPRPVPPIGAAPVPGIDRGGPPHLRQAPEVPGTVAAPLPGPTTGPFFGRPQAPPQRGALPPAGPRTPGLAGMPGSSSTDAPAVPQPAVRPRRPPELPDGALPRMPSPAVGMTPPTSAAVPPRAPPRPVAPAVPDASLPPAAPVAPAAPVVQTAPAVPGAQRAAPQPTRPGAPVADKAAVPAPRVESVEAKRGRDDAAAGQRRRTPASRQKQFER
jgi:hypothetical protein